MLMKKLQNEKQNELLMFPSPHQKLLQTWEQTQKAGNSPGRELGPPATNERNSSTCVSGPASQRRWVNYSTETQKDVGKALNTWDRATQVYAEQRTKWLSQGQRRKESCMRQDIFSKISWSFQGPIKRGMPQMDEKQTDAAGPSCHWPVCIRHVRHSQYTFMYTIILHLLTSTDLSLLKLTRILLYISNL